MHINTIERLWLLYDVRSTQWAHFNLMRFQFCHHRIFVDQHKKKKQQQPSAIWFVSVFWLDHHCIYSVRAHSSHLNSFELTLEKYYIDSIHLTSSPTQTINLFMYIIDILQKMKCAFFPQRQNISIWRLLYMQHFKVQQSDLL